MVSLVSMGVIVLGVIIVVGILLAFVLNKLK